MTSLANTSLDCREGGKPSEREKADGRFPYTHAADFLRMAVGPDYDKGLISRAAAASARATIARELGLDDEYVAQVLARAFYRDEDKLVQRSVAALSAAKGG